jgi:hypothetical protein
VIQSVSSGAKTLEEAQGGQFGLPFLQLGEALHAYHWAEMTGCIPLFLFDEVDKLPEHLQDMLLQLCEQGYAHVPRYDKPIGIYNSENGSVRALASPGRYLHFQQLAPQALRAIPLALLLLMARLSDPRRRSKDFA